MVDSTWGVIDLRDVGKNIRDLRERAKLTQDELAERLCTTRQTVSNYERGKTRPDVEQILRLAAIFGTDANAILYGLPGTEYRSRASSCAVLSGMIWGVLQAVYWLLVPAAEQQRAHLNIMMMGLLRLLLQPVTLLVFGWFLIQLISVLTTIKLPKTKRAAHIRRVLVALAGILIVLPSLSCVAVTQFRKGDMLPEWLFERFVQIFVYWYTWAKYTFYLYPILGAALRLLNFPAQQKNVCEDK